MRNCAFCILNRIKRSVDPSFGPSNAIRQPYIASIWSTPNFLVSPKKWGKSWPRENPRFLQNPEMLGVPPDFQIVALFLSGHLMCNQ